MSESYGVAISWSEEDGIFVAEAPELPGCTAPAASRANALLEVETASARWLDAAREQGRPLPEPKGRKLPDA